jgi:GDPmannose 4,6-dehydratase
LKKALITGITGQDGSYLAEFLLNKGYEVHGIRRRSSSFNTSRIDHLYNSPRKDQESLVLHHGDMTDAFSLMQVIGRVAPDEIYNLAAQSHVHVSFEEPEYTANTVALGALRILEAIRTLGMNDRVRFYQASTSELYGNTTFPLLNEESPFLPVSPYAVAKLYAHQLTVNFRDAYGLFACNGILFNHESPRRGETFVTRKITRALTRIAYGTQESLILGNINSLRDWGHAKDYVEAQWLMLQQSNPADFVIATGQQRSVRNFIQDSAGLLGIEITWEGEGEEEVGLDQHGKKIIEIDPRYFRPLEVPSLCGDSSKALALLGWKPKISYQALVEEMVKSDESQVQMLTSNSNRYR